MMKPSIAQVEAGQAVYSRPALSVYDLLVLGVSNRYIWKCSTDKLLAHYNEHVSSNHLDVGVGTGYFLDQCRFPSSAPRVALMDMNPNTLEFASNRISRYAATTYRQNVLEPISEEIAKFDSVGINYLLHCLPGALKDKAAAFDHLVPMMNPGATLFGSTILWGGVERNWAAVRLMRFYNRKGIFSNLEDDLQALEQALCERFENVSVVVTGCVALFSGRLR